MLLCIAVNKWRQILWKNSIYKLLQESGTQNNLLCILNKLKVTQSVTLSQLCLENSTNSKIQQIQIVMEFMVGTSNIFSSTRMVKIK